MGGSTVRLYIRRGSTYLKGDISNTERCSVSTAEKGFLGGDYTNLTAKL